MEYFEEYSVSTDIYRTVNKRLAKRLFENYAENLKEYYSYEDEGIPIWDADATDAVLYVSDMFREGLLIYKDKTVLRIWINKAEMDLEQIYPHIVELLKG
jgi:hypothetical protein